MCKEIINVGSGIKREKFLNVETFLSGNYFLTFLFYFKNRPIDLKYGISLVRALKWTFKYIRMRLLYPLI
jgi:hypothetical protein